VTLRRRRKENVSAHFLLVSFKPTDKIQQLLHTVNLSIKH